MPKLSIVIPCYNEEVRIVKFFDAYAERVAATGLDYEFVMVDDGSKDKTLAMLQERRQKNSRICVLTHQPNRGRGYSVRQGILAATGELIFETDIDNSYDVPELEKFLHFLETNANYDLVIASREQKEAEAVVQQPGLRVLAGKLFHGLFFLVFGGEFTDVMAGCKLYRREAAQVIFKHQYDNEFLGAAETVFSAVKLGFRVKELPVQWQDDAEGSKVRPFRAAWRTLIGIMQMKVREWKGKYKRTYENPNPLA